MLIVVRLDNTIILLLIGNGNLENKIKAEAKRLNIDKSILFLGLRDNIPELLQSFDLFLFPSLYEGLPVTLIEAQASGLKVITSSAVTKEANITGLVTYLDLEKSEIDWADSVLSNIDYNRKNTLNQIIKGGYDIYENARKLQTFYLNIN